MTLIELCGWTAAILFAFCGAPQAWKSFKEKHSMGISWGFILMWWWAEVLMLVYVLPKQDAPLIFNLVLNLFFASFILWYKAFPKVHKVCYED